MPTIRTWEVTVKVFGSVSIKKPISFNTDKELNIGEIFRSDIELSPSNDGFDIKTTVRTNEQGTANKIALLFIGRMLDILSIKTDLPLFVSLSNGHISKRQENVKAVIEKSEFQSAFELSRRINIENSTFHRGLSWYRKGLYTEDPFDKFLAFWNSIEIVANKYNPNPSQCQGKGKGNKCHIWECFKDIYGSNCNQWPIIKGQNSWIDENYKVRTDIAHGIITIDIKSVEDVVNRLDIIKQVAYNFLVDWAQRKFHYSFED